MKHKKIIIACDYRGVEMRNELLQHLTNEGLDVKNIGIEAGSKMDYIDITKLLVDELYHDPEAVGILICGSGQGVSIYANRANHIRAAMCRTSDDAESVRSKLDANVLCLGSKYMTPQEAQECVSVFLNTSFHAERHAECVSKLNVKATDHANGGVNLITRGIVVCDGHVLLTTTTSENTEFPTGLYFLPGGHVDHNESATDALKREFMEEANLVVSKVEFAGAVECSWDRKGTLYHELNLLYSVRIDGENPKVPPKAVDPFHEFVWFPIAEIDNLKILPEKFVPIIKQTATELRPLFLSQMRDDIAA